MVSMIETHEAEAKMTRNSDDISTSPLGSGEKRLGSQNVTTDSQSLRNKAVQFAVANTAIEGGCILPETQKLMDEWARGEIDDDELIERGLEKFGPHSA